MKTNHHAVYVFTEFAEVAVMIAGAISAHLRSSIPSGSNRQHYASCPSSEFAASVDFDGEQGTGDAAVFEVYLALRAVPACEAAMATSVPEPVAATKLATS